MKRISPTPSVVTWLRHVCFFIFLVGLPASLQAAGPGKIAYVADHEIYLMNADGSDKQPLGIVTAGGQAFDVSLSGDEAWVAYTGFDSAFQTGLLVARAEPIGPSNTPVFIANAINQYRTSWHPNGRWLAFTAYDNTTVPQVYLAQVFNESGAFTGAAPTALTTNGGSGLWHGDSAFSPDGQHVAISRFRSEIILANAFDASGNRNSTVITTAVPAVTSIATGQADWPCFNPDGKKLVFRHTNHASDVYGIATLTIRNGSGVLTPESGTNPRIQMVTPSADIVGHPTWSQDGLKIAFFELTTFTRIVILNASSSEHATNNPRVQIAGMANVDTSYPCFPQQGGAAPVVYTINPPPNLISWWTAENAAWDIAGIGQGVMHNADNFNANGYGTGKVGRAFLFDGVDDHVQGRSTGVSMTSNCTIEGWIRPTEARAGDMMIICKQNDDEQNVSYSLLLRDNHVTFRANMNGIEHVLQVGGPPVALNQWTHVAFTESAEEGRLKIYINGVQQAITAAVPPRPTTTGPLTIGAAVSTAHPTATPAAPFAGLIDELSRYNRALSSTEIQLIVQAGVGGKDFHDPARDFSATANPNQPWKYGWIQGGAINPALLEDGNDSNGTLFPPPAALQGTAYVYQMATPDGSELLFNSSPAARATFTGENASLVDLSPRQLAMLPSVTGDYTVLRWTAPESGKYAISATFTGAENTPATSDVHIFHGATSLFDGTVSTFLGAGTSFTDDVQLTAGDKVDWIVGANASNGNDHTGVVASVAFLEPFMAFQAPTIEHLAFSPPMMAGKTVTFTARNGDRTANPTMTARIQYSATPGDPGSWVDLPSGTMTPTGGLSFIHSANNLPEGTFAFRIATEVAGLGTTFSTPSETFVIAPAGPYYEMETVATPASTPSGDFSHREDSITLTYRFRNVGGASVPSSQALTLKARVPTNTTVIGTPAGSKLVTETIAGVTTKYVTWPIIRSLNPIDARIAFTAAATTDLYTAPNHGLEDGDIVTVSSTGTLPQGLAADTPYKVASSTSNSFKLTLLGSATILNILTNGTGTHSVTRAPAPPTPFTADAKTDQLTSVGHTLLMGDRVRVMNSGGALPGGLETDTTYVVFKFGSTPATGKIILQRNGKFVDITSAGTGVSSFYRYDNRETDQLWQTRSMTVKVDTPAAKAFQVDKTKDTIVMSGHGFKTGSYVEIVATGLPRLVPLPVGLQAGIRYQVDSPTASSFKLLHMGMPVDIGSYGDPLKSVLAVTDAALMPSVNYVSNSIVSTASLVKPGPKIGSIVTEVIQKEAAPVDCTVANPLHLTAELVSSSQLKKGGIVQIDFTVKNDAGMFGTAMLGVRAPAGLTILGTGGAPVFVDGNGQTGGSPIDPITKKQVAPYLTGKFNPSLETDADYQQMVYFSIGQILPGGSQKCRVSFRVQYDLDLTSTPVIQFTQAVASIIIQTATRYNRSLETPLSLPIVAAPNDPKPWITLETSHFGFADHPDSPGVKMVAHDGKPVTGSGPKRNNNNIVYQITYENKGTVPAEFIRLYSAIPTGTTYVTGSAKVKAASGDHELGSSPVLTSNGTVLIFDLPYLEAKGELGSIKTLEFTVKLNTGVPLGTIITHPGGLLISREFATPFTAIKNLETMVVNPARMTYERYSEQSVIENPDGSIAGSGGLQEIIFFKNEGGMAASGVGIKYTLPLGVKFWAADYVLPDTTYSKWKRATIAGRTIGSPKLVHDVSTSGTVTFNVGTVAPGAFGWVRVSLKQHKTTLPATGHGAYDLDGIIDCYDSTTGPPPPPPPPGQRRGKYLLPPLGSLRLLSRATFIDPETPRPYALVQGPLASVVGSLVTYQVTFGNHGANPAAGGIFIETPEGADFVSSRIVSFNPVGANPAILTRQDVPASDTTTNVGQFEGTYYTYGDFRNVHGGVAYVRDDALGGSIPPGSTYIIEFVVRVTGNVNSDRRLRTTAFIGSVSRSSDGFPTFIVDQNEPHEVQQQRIRTSQQGVLAPTLLGTADKPNTKFTLFADQMGMSSMGASITGVDFIQLGNSAITFRIGPNQIVAAGGGNVVANDGAGLIGSDGASIVAAGGGNIVAAGGGNITVDVPGRGRMAISAMFADLPAIVAAGGGNIVAGGGLNLIRPHNLIGGDGASLIGGDGASLVGMDGASLVGMDGASILATIKSNAVGGYNLITPAGVVHQLVNNKGTLAIAKVDAATLIGKGGAGIVAAGGGNIIDLRGPTFFNGNTIVAGGGGNVVNKNGNGIVAGGGGNIVAGGGGNIVAGGGGN